MAKRRLGTPLLVGVLAGILGVVIVSASATNVVFPAIGDINTVAGSGVGDGGLATNAGLSGPTGKIHLIVGWRFKR